MKIHPSQITLAVLLASAVAFAQKPADVECRKTETQAECHARLKCKPNEELEECQKRLLKCKADEKLADCKKRAAANPNQQGQGQQGQQGEGNRDRADQEAAERRQRENADREAAERRDRDNADREAAERRQRENAQRENADREAAERRRRDDDDRREEGSRRRRGGGGGDGDRGRRSGGGGGRGFVANKTFGLGLELGEPTGLNGKVFVSPSVALDFGAGYMYRHWYFHQAEGFHTYLDVLFHPVVLAHASGFELPFYIGVGGRFWSFHWCEGNVCGYPGQAFGIRIPVGIDFDFNNVPLDLFLQLVPVVDFVYGDYYDRYPDRGHFGLDFSVGLRYWFK